MDNDTQKIFEEQLAILPKSVVVFLSSVDWNTQLDAIASMYNLDEEQTDGLKREVSLIFAGLVHPDELTTTLQKEVGLQGSVLEAIVIAVEQKVMAPVRGALVGFFESEIAKENSQQPARVEAAQHQPSVTPENLPIAPETEHLIPPIPSKIPAMVVPQKEVVEAPAAVHPFEEKMRQVFTAGQPTMGTVVIEPAPSVMPSTMEPEVAPVAAIISPVPEKPSVVPVALVEPQVAYVPPPVPRNDPYREPID